MKYIIEDNKIKKIDISGLIIKGIIDTINKERRTFSGFSSVEIIDRQGDFLPISEFEKVMPILMKRGALIMDSHSNHPVGKIISYEFKDTDNNEKGLYLTAEIFSDYPTDDKIWEQIKNGELSGFSLGGKAGTKIPQCSHIGCYNILGDIEAWEFSVVSTPANSLANIDKVNKLAKSDTKKSYTITKDGHIIQKPFANYKDFARCITENKDKDDPNAYCGAIKHKVEKRADFTPEDAKRIGDQLNIDWTKIDQNEFLIGLNIELEHGTKFPETNVTDDDEIATTKIALAHLNEFPDYYNEGNGLPEMEKRLKGIKKEKVYVDNPQDAPKDKRVQEGERGGIYYESEGKISSKEPKEVHRKIKQRRIKANMSNRYKIAAIGESKVLKKMGESCCINANLEIKWNMPVDLIDEKKRIAYEVKTFSKESKDIKVKTNLFIKGRKEKWASNNDYQLKTIVVIYDKRNNMTEGYIRDGYGGFRPSNMERIW